MTLVRTLFYICAKNKIECSAVHVVGVLNQAADALSRGQLSKCYSLIPDADRHATLPIYTVGQKAVFLDQNLHLINSHFKTDRVMSFIF